MEKSAKFKENLNKNKNIISLKNRESKDNNKLLNFFRKPTSQIYSDYQTISDLFTKKQFKKIVKTIKLKSDKFGKFFLDEWKLLHIRIISLQIILDDKISKYYNTNKINLFGNYINDVNSDINNWIILINELISKNDKIYTGSFIDFIICFILKNCIILAKKYIHFGYIKDAIVSLSLSLRLISQTKMKFSSPDSYFFASEIFLYLSSLMISERNYNTAMNLISLSVKFSFISLELRLCKNIDNNQTLFDLNKYQNEKNMISKILFNLSIAFYQLSVCHENQNNFYNSFLAIQNSNFFGKFTDNNDCNLYQNLIKKIESRLLMRNRLLLFFERNRERIELKENIDNKKFIRKKITYEERKHKKFENLEKYLDKLKIKEIDDDNPDLFYKIGDKMAKPKLIKITKQLKLLNYLMKDEFKDLIHSMKKIEINKLDKETINIISKRIINLKNKEYFKLENKIKPKFNIKKILEERKSNIIIEKDNEDKKNENILDILNHRKKIKNMNNMNKLNTFRSTTALSSSTMINKKDKRLQSSFHSRIEQNKLYNNSNNSISNIHFINSFNKLNDTNISMNISPSAFASIRENSIINNNNKNISNTFRIINRKLHLSNNFKKNNQRNAMVINLKYSTPKYSIDKIFLNKTFRKKYSFLENQFNKEIDFHKILLKSKSINEELIRPKKPNIKEIKDKAKKFVFCNYYNELMNAKEKQIIINKNYLTRKIKVNNNENIGQSNDIYLDTEEIKEKNDKFIKKLKNNIMEINTRKKSKEKAKKF